MRPRVLGAPKLTLERLLGLSARVRTIPFLDLDVDPDSTFFLALDAALAVPLRSLPLRAFLVFAAIEAESLLPFLRAAAFSAEETLAALLLFAFNLFVVFLKSFVSTLAFPAFWLFLPLGAGVSCGLDFLAFFGGAGGLGTLLPFPSNRSPFKFSGSFLVLPLFFSFFALNRSRSSAGIFFLAAIDFMKLNSL